ncbi:MULTISPECIES: HipA family kinase [Xenorhabdus]|uniref:HipA family kinase n=1 Tax=Xenorhabdus TaxID=626 RepID=UPI0006490A92|nr:MULTISPECIES: HipA family kinase [Xenorhabdus]
MIKINDVIDKLERLKKGHSHPFIGIDESGKKWFVKTYSHEPENELCALFNEFVAFKLAEKINLPWPKGHIARLSENIKCDLNISRSHVVAYEYITDMENLPDEPQFNDEQLHDLYGKSVFDNWLSIDDVKNDTCKLLNGRLIFMDAGIAFVGDNGKSWEKEGFSWSKSRLHTKSSPYHVGKLKDVNKFKPWLDKIYAIPPDYYQTIVNDIPEDWHVPESYKSKFVEVFSSSRETFIPMMHECIEADLHCQE